MSGKRINSLHIGGTRGAEKVRGPSSFEFEPKSAVLNMRLSESLLDAMKAKATAKGVPFTRYLRLLIEQDLARP